MANEKNNTAPADREKRLWVAADQLWENSLLKRSKYSTLFLGLILLDFGDNAFYRAENASFLAKELVYMPDEIGI